MVLGTAVILVHIYWYSARYWHLRDKASVIQPKAFTETRRRVVDFEWDAEWNESVYVAWQTSDLLANQVAAALTPASWVIIGSWMCTGPTTGT